MTVLIDAVNQKQDTLPHEYAHHYIAWFRDTSIVQEAIKKWGSEEALVQSIGEQVVKQKGEAYNWWKKFTRWMLNRFNKLSNLQKEELTQVLTDAFLTRQDLSQVDNIKTPPQQDVEFFQTKRSDIRVKEHLNDLLERYAKALGIDLISMDKYNEVRAAAGKEKLDVNAVANMHEKIIAIKNADGLTLPEEIAHFLLWNLYQSGKNDPNSDIMKMINLIVPTDSYSRTMHEYHDKYVDPSMSEEERKHMIAMEAIAKLMSERIYEDFDGLNRQLKESFGRSPIANRIRMEFMRLVNSLKDLFFKVIKKMGLSIEDNRIEITKISGELNDLITTYSDVILEEKPFTLNDAEMTFVESDSRVEELRDIVIRSIDSIKNRLNSLTRKVFGMTPEEVDRFLHYQDNKDRIHITNTEENQEFLDSQGIRWFESGETKNFLSFNGIKIGDNLYFLNENNDVVALDLNNIPGKLIGGNKFFHGPANNESNYHEKPEIEKQKDLKEFRENSVKYKKGLKKNIKGVRERINLMKEQLQEKKYSYAIVEFINSMNEEWEDILSEDIDTIEKVNRVMDFTFQYGPIIHELRRLNNESLQSSGESIIKIDEFNKAEYERLQKEQKELLDLDSLSEDKMKRLKEIQKKLEELENFNTKNILDDALNKINTISSKVIKENDKIVRDYFTEKYDEQFANELLLTVNESGSFVNTMFTKLTPTDKTSSNIISFMYNHISKLNFKIKRATEQIVDEIGLFNLSQGIDNKRLIELKDGKPTGFLISDTKWSEWYTKFQEFRTSMHLKYLLPKDKTERQNTLTGKHVKESDLSEEEKIHKLYGYTLEEMDILINKYKDKKWFNITSYMERNPKPGSIYYTHLQYRKEYREWFEKNSIEDLEKALKDYGVTEPIKKDHLYRERAVDAIINKQREKLDKFEFENWLFKTIQGVNISDRRLKNEEEESYLMRKYGEVILRGNITRPSDGRTRAIRRIKKGKITFENVKTVDYSNPEFEKLTDKEKEFHSALVKMRETSLENLKGYDMADAAWMKYFMPQVNASAAENLSKGRFWDRSNWVRQADGLDEEIMERGASILGSDYNLRDLAPPVRYITSALHPIDNISTDLVSSYIKFLYMSVNYNEKTNDVDFVKSMALKLQSAQSPKSTEVFTSDSPLFRKMADFLEFAIGEKGAGRIDFKIPFTDTVWAVEKFSENLAAYVRSVSLIGNLLAIGSGVMKSRIVFRIEKSVNTYIDEEDWAFANGLEEHEIAGKKLLLPKKKMIGISKRIKSIMWNWAKDKKDNYTFAEEDMINKFWSQGDYRFDDTNRHYLLQYAMRRMPWVMWNAGDLWMKITSIRSIANQYKNVDGKYVKKELLENPNEYSNFLDDYDRMLTLRGKEERTKEDQEELDKLQMGIESIIDEVLTRSEQMKALADQSLTELQKTELHRNVWTKHLLIFRNFFFVTIPNAYKKEWNDYSNISTVNGVYTPKKRKGFLKPSNIGSSLGQYFKHGHNSNFKNTLNLIFNIEKSPAWEKMNVEDRELLVRLKLMYGYVFALQALATLFYTMGADDEEEPWKNLLAALFLRTYNESLADIPGIPPVGSATELYELVKNPIVSGSFFERGFEGVASVPISIYYGLTGKDESKRSGKFKDVNPGVEAAIKAIPGLNNFYNYSPLFPLGPDDRFLEATSDALDWQKKRVRESLFVKPVKLLTPMTGEITYKKEKK